MAHSTIQLQSESFDRAAYTFATAVQQFPGPNFQGSIDQFERTVNKLVMAMAMQAENDCRKFAGREMAYDENAFLSI